MAIHLDRQIDHAASRRYHVYIPDSPPTTHVPMIIVLHGGGMFEGARIMGRRWGVDLDAAAPELPVWHEVENYILVFPEADEALGGMWTHFRFDSGDYVTHNLTFVSDLLDVLEHTTLPTAQVDPEHVYVAGFSNGGSLVWHIAYSTPTLIDRFRGFGVVARSLDPEKEQSYRQRHGTQPSAVPLLYMHGTADPGFRASLLQQEADVHGTHPYHTVKAMLARNGVADDTPATTVLEPGSTNLTEVVTQTWVGTEAFAAVTVINGGHNWPTPRTPPTNPPVASHVHASAMMLRFWRTHAGLPA